MSINISVIIPFFYKSENKIGSDLYFSLFAFEKSLSAVFKSKYKNFEVIAVSDFSSKESLAIAMKYKCRVVKLKKNHGSGFSRNKGASLAKGKILVFLDSDVEIKKDALTLIDKSYKTKKNNVALQGIYSHEPNYNKSTTQYLQSYHCYYLFSYTKKFKYTQTLCTNIFAIKKDIFLELKGFDSNFNNANSEDAEFGFRLIKAGYKIPIERKLKTVHHTNFGLWTCVKRITRIHTGEMKMYLRNKTFLMKAKQKNYLVVLIGIALITLGCLLSFVNYFYTVPYFSYVFITLNLLFIGIHLNFITFIFHSKGFLSACKAIIYSYVHRFLFIYCVCSGILQFYVFNNRY